MADYLGKQLGNYRLTHLLGEGGFGEVYLAEHLYLQTQAAIKLLHTRLTQEDQQRFLSEAQTVARLRHSHIVQVLDFGIEGGTPYLVMDYAPGGTLRQRHPRGTTLPPLTVLSYVQQIADALQYAHDQRLIHRDIKPENLLLGRQNEVMLSDFGIATVAQTTSDVKTQGFAGTASYAAPEQLRGKPVQASDQYALAVIVYEWLSGDTPFHGSALEVATQQVLSPPPPLREKLPGIASIIEQVVMTALSKDPKERFGSVRAFANALDQAIQAAPATVSSYSAPAPHDADQAHSEKSGQTREASIYFAPTQLTPPLPPVQPGDLPTTQAQGTPPADHTPVPPGAPEGVASGGQTVIPPGWASGAPPATPAEGLLDSGTFNTPPPGQLFATPSPSLDTPGSHAAPPEQPLQAPPARPRRGKWIAALAGGVLVVVLIVGLVVERGWLGFGNQTAGQASPTGLPTRQSTQALSGGTLCLATDFPLSGASGSAGQSTEHGADLAISQHADLGSGYTLQVRHFDDASNPSTGAQNVGQMAQTPCILGMVGPFTSRVAGAEIPAAVRAGLPMISPSNTSPGLTLEQYSADYGFDYLTFHPAGQPNVYFRIPGHDVVQGQVDADFTIGAAPNGLGARSVFVVDDASPYGKHLADFFSQEFTAKGGTILARDELPSNNDGQLRALAQKIAATNPAAVFYGGSTSPVGGPLKAQLVAAGYTGPMVGGDGIVQDPDFLAQAGSAANNTYATIVAPAPATFISGAPLQFVNDYRVAFGSDPSPYSVFAYDAAMIEIQAIKQLLAAGKEPTRALLIEQIQHMQYDGLSGHIRFDQNGDNAGSRVLSIYQVTGGQWVFVASVTA